MSIHGQVNKPNWSICTMEYHPAIKRNEGWIYAMPWMNFKNISTVQKVRHKRPHIVWFTCNAGNREPAEMESKWEVFRGRGRREWGLTANGCVFLFGATKEFLDLTVTTVVQPRAYTETQLVEGWVSCHMNHIPISLEGARQIRNYEPHTTALNPNRKFLGSSTEHKSMDFGGGEINIFKFYPSNYDL